MPILKSSFDKILKSHVVYKITYNECTSIYVGQTSPHTTTRNSKHRMKDSPVGHHLVECCGTAHNTEWEILDACRGVEKLMTIEAIYIKKLSTGAGIDIEVLVQIEKFDFLNSRNNPVHVNSNFCHSQQIKSNIR